jgi:hypothetical protein
MKAFISYQTSDKIIAGKIKTLLAELCIPAFLAHEDIEVSEEWRLKILEEVALADLFICLLSENYYQSIWCIQESGVAAYRKDMSIIPLSIDGSIPQGFISHIQSTRIAPERFSSNDLIPIIAKRDVSWAIDLIIDLIGKSRSFRGAEANFQLLLPYTTRMFDAQAIRLLEKAAENGQVHHAGLCAKEYLPPLLEKYGHLVSTATLDFLKKICSQYE